MFAYQPTKAPLGSICTHPAERDCGNVIEPRNIAALVVRIGGGNRGRHTYNFGVSTIAQQPPYLTINQTAELLGVHANSVRRFIARGELPAVRLGHGARARVRIDPRDLGALTEPVRSQYPPRDWRANHPRPVKDVVVS
jgi:excisionase family DNA binding protein